MLGACDFTLLRNFYSDFMVTANPEFEVEEGFESRYKAEVQCIRRENGLYVIQLSIADDNEEGTAWAYSYQIQGFAYLKLVDAAIHDQDHRESATAYGIQVLFGSIREQLTLMTARGPWKDAGVNLDLCDLRPIMKDLTERWAREAKEA